VKKKVQRKIFFDSISIRVLAFLITGKKIYVQSGVDYFLNEVKNSDSNCFLVANKSVQFQNSFVLPQFNDMDEDELNKVDWTYIQSFENIYIGISSPKQEKLAEFLQTKYGMGNYFCLGAALYVNPIDFRNSSLKFLTFLKQDYERSITKIRITLIQTLRILFFSSVRGEFREFILRETSCR
jgi:hypothetical protein